MVSHFTYNKIIKRKRKENPQDNQSIIKQPTHNQQETNQIKSK